KGLTHGVRATMVPRLTCPSHRTRGNDDEPSTCRARQRRARTGEPARMSRSPESRSGRRARLDKLRESILHRKVLARHLPAMGGPAFQGRWTRRQWARASLFATLGALVAALVPGFSAPLAGTAEASLAAPRTTLALALPALPLHRRAAADSWQMVTV